MKILEVVELSESQELVDELIKLILKLHAKFTDPSSGTQTDIGKLQTPTINDNVPKSIANFSGVKRPEDVSKITADAIGTARENNDSVQINYCRHYNLHRKVVLQYYLQLVRLHYIF